jgi:hypothetical protein
VEAIEEEMTNLEKRLKALGFQGLLILDRGG